MTVLSLIVSVAVAGLVVWLVGLIPMPPKFHLAIRVIALVALILWLLDAFGLFGARGGLLNYRLH